MSIPAEHYARLPAALPADVSVLAGIAAYTLAEGAEHVGQARNRLRSRRRAAHSRRVRGPPSEGIGTVPQTGHVSRLAEHERRPTRPCPSTNTRRGRPGEESVRGEVEFRLCVVANASSRAENGSSRIHDAERVVWRRRRGARTTSPFRHFHCVLGPVAPAEGRTPAGRRVTRPRSHRWCPGRRLAPERTKGDLVPRAASTRMVEMRAGRVHRPCERTASA